MSEDLGGNVLANDSRFPCRQEDYIRITGELLPAILRAIFGELGFRADPKPRTARGVDIEVFLGNNLVIVIEVLNWSIGSRLDYWRMRSIIRNLNRFNCNKLFVYTIPLDHLDAMDEHGIQRIEIGYQVLPENFYNHYLPQNKVIRRKIDNASTRNEIRTKILHYLENSGISMPTARSS